MAPVIVGRFATVIEAQIAASALRSGGLHPEVFDSEYGSMLWMQQLTVPGFRLVVPEAEAADSIAYLRSLPPTIENAGAKIEITTAAFVKANAWWLAVMGSIFYFGPFWGWHIGWLAVGLRPDIRTKRANATLERSLGIMMVAPIVILILLIAFQPLVAIVGLFVLVSIVMGRRFPNPLRSLR